MATSAERFVLGLPYVRASSGISFARSLRPTLNSRGYGWSRLFLRRVGRLQTIAYGLTFSKAGFVSLGVLLLVQAAVLLAFVQDLSAPSSPAKLPNAGDDSSTVPNCAISILAGNSFWNHRCGSGWALSVQCVYALKLRVVRPRTRGLCCTGRTFSSSTHSSADNTVIGTVLAGLLGILAASVVGLDSTTLPLLIIPALAAAPSGSPRTRSRTWQAC